MKFDNRESPFGTICDQYTLTLWVVGSNGKLKKRMRIHPSDITMNIGKGVPVPECPIETLILLSYVRCDTADGKTALKGQSDKEKYEKAKNLTNNIDNIRATFTKTFTSKDVTKKQIAVTTYLIDKLAVRTGNEKVNFDLSFGSVREQD
ncbi:DNA topoisomerase 1 [Raphanus sativus]|nr:DNA topoisomerase 1 [Raphanus sativus]